MSWWSTSAGATTDVHSVVRLDPEDAGLSREVVATHAGHPHRRGRPRHALERAEHVGGGREAGLLDEDLRPAAVRRAEDPSFLPTTDAERHEDELIAAAAATLALRRHAGRSQRRGRARTAGSSSAPARTSARSPCSWVRAACCGTPTRVRDRILGAADRRLARGLAAAGATHESSSTATTCSRRSACCRSGVRERRRHWHVACRRARRPPAADQRLPRALQVARGGRPRSSCAPGSPSSGRRCGPPAGPIGGRAGDRGRALELQAGPGSLRRGPGRGLVVAFPRHLRRRCAIILWLLNFFLVVVLPLVIALLIAALASPLVVWGQRLGIPRKLAALLVVILGIGVHRAAGDLRQQPGLLGRRRPLQAGHDGIDQIRDWLRDGPLHVTDKQLSEALDKAQEQISELRQGRGRQGRRGRCGGRARGRGRLHRAVLDVLLPRRRPPHLGLDGAALPARRPAPGRLVGPRGLEVADPVRAGHRAGRRHRCDRHHDRCRDPAGAVRRAPSVCWSSSAPSCR